jgi:hypothetical protein
MDRLLPMERNPLKPEVSPSNQACLPGFFTEHFKLYCLLLSHKFSFNLNEIKFCTVYELVNPGGKIAYFNTKFRPVNRMYFIKCCVNSSLHNSGCCIRSVAPWITVLSRHTVFTNRVIYYKFTFVRYSAKQGTTHRPTSHLAHCVSVLQPREHRRQGW